MPELQIGDTVQLKSRGPVMTILGHAPSGRTFTGPKGIEQIPSETMVICQWFAGDDLKSANFDLRTLEIFKLAY